jgi:exonuclease SbcC
MRILWIRADNFKCYSNIRVPAQGILPEGLIFVEGENSTGKSSLFDSIFYAFFYDPTTTKELGTKDDLIRRGYSETDVEVAFELDNKCFIIRRRHSKKTSVEAYLVGINPKDALNGIISDEKKICEGVSEVEKKITDLLNINKEKALNTLIVRQGSVQALAEAKGADLRNIIYELFQLDYYRDKALENIKDKKNEQEDRKREHAIQRTTDNILSEISEKKEGIDKSKEEISGIDEAIDRLQMKAGGFPDIKEMNEIKSKTDRMETLDRIIKTKEISISEVGDAFSLKVPIDIKDIDVKKKELEKEIKTNKKKQATIQEDIDKVEGERLVIDAELENLRKRKTSLETIAETGEEPKCDVCEQEIEEVKFNELLESVKRSIPALLKGKTKKDDLIKKNKSEIGEIDKINLNLNQKTLRLDQLVKNVEEMKSYSTDKENLSTEITESLKGYKVKSLEEMAQKYDLDNFAELFENVKKLDDDIQKHSIEKTHLKETIEKDQKTIERLNKEIEKNKEKEEKIAEIDLEIALLSAVQDHVEKFIAEEIISNRMLANIQHSTRGYIYRFTRGRYSELYLEPTRTKTLNMSIKDDELGFVKSQTLLSGGDKAAIGLGLRIGVSELLKRIRPLKSSPYQPPKMDILVLDEPLGSLDDARRSKVIEGLVAEERFSQIFLITHTNIRKRFRAPIINIQTSAAGSVASFYTAPSDIEEEAEEAEE